MFLLQTVAACLLYYAGALDVVLGLRTCLDNAMVTSEAEVLFLSRENFNRLFNRKYAQTTLRHIRERLIMRLYLYIHRADSLHHHLTSPFLKFLSFMLQDPSAVEDLKKKKRREREIKRGLSHNVDQDDTDANYVSKNADEISGMLKMLDMDPKSSKIRLPAVESSQRVINEIDEGLRNWVETTRGTNSPVPNQQSSLASPTKRSGRHSSFREVGSTH